MQGIAALLLEYYFNCRNERAFVWKTVKAKYREFVIMQKITKVN